VSNTDFTVFVVDDEPAVTRALGRLLGAHGYNVRASGSAEEFLQQHDPAPPGCILLDIGLPNLDGLELQATLAQRGVQRPIVFLTGCRDVLMGVQAMRAGAVDFLLKPIQEENLLAAVTQALERDTAARRANDKQAGVQRRLSKLTPREREVMGHVVAGRLNKQIASDLGIVEKTIKVHRGRLMAKLGLRSVTDLVRLAEGARPPEAKPS
jgi:FixJ family two-component response regulator